MLQSIIHSSRAIACVSLLSLAATFVHAASIDPKLVTPGYGWVLLDNGHVFHGQIEPHGQDVTIQRESLSISRKAKDIRCIAPSLKGLYEYQVSITKRWGTGEHLHLARWCLENDLLDEVSVHYEWLRVKIPQDIKFRQLEAQLRDKLINDPVTRAAYQLPPDREELERESRAVRHANFSATAELAPELTAEYREFVIPIVRSRCGQSGCHGMSSGQQFVVPPQRSQSAGNLHRSLQGALAAINYQNPRESDLLRKAVSPHSIQSNPPIDVAKQTDVDLMIKLTAWVDRVAFYKKANGTSPSTDTQRVNYDAQTQLQRMVPGPTTPPMSAPSGAVGNDQILTLEEAIRTLEKKEQARANQLDLFDPEAFNRQQAKPNR